ncbi:MAG: divergent polysaccharide deacetylase family protein [Pseudomonadota bacterium]
MADKNARRRQNSKARQRSKRRRSPPILEARIASGSRRASDRRNFIYMLSAGVVGGLAGLALAIFGAAGALQRSPEKSASSFEIGATDLAASDASRKSLALASVQPGAARVFERSLAMATVPAPTRRLRPPSAELPSTQRSVEIVARPIPKGSDRAMISLIVDDLGLSPAALSQVMAAPGPLTLSFLPYGRDLQRKADAARAAGHAVLLHLPMEPFGAHDPGPDALMSSMSRADLRAATKRNLAQFDGYAGVNNHMGSRLTADTVAMREVLSVLKEHGIFFLDSVTSAKTVAGRTSVAMGLTTYRRDVFLDAEPGRASVIAGFADLEAIARARGYAVGILHPRTESLRALRAWTTTAEARGFDLVPITALPSLDRQQQGPAARIAALSDSASS